MQLILVLGVSGAGKNVALGALEDIGFATVNNLPAELLVATVEAMLATHSQPLAISVNAHTPTFVADFDAACDSIAHVHPALPLRVIRIDASETTLLRRFAETRRKHPFASDHSTLQEAIAEERLRLHAIVVNGFDVDTSSTSTHLLRQRVRQFANAIKADAELPLLEISSFAYRNGIPPDADLVFDARILPNPFYEPGLAVLTGRDAPVAEYLRAQPETGVLVRAIRAYLEVTLPGFVADNRARVHVAVGCTGGKHRSVYVADALKTQMIESARVLRHDREHPIQE
jgi:RNase adapter protein RapZ